MGGAVRQIQIAVGRRQRRYRIYRPDQCRPRRNQLIPSPVLLLHPPQIHRVLQRIQVIHIHRDLLRVLDPLLKIVYKIGGAGVFEDGLVLLLEGGGGGEGGSEGGLGRERGEEGGDGGNGEGGEGAGGERRVGEGGEQGGEPSAGLEQGLVELLEVVEPGGVLHDGVGEYI